MTQIFTAKTVEDAKALASRTFGTAEDMIVFEILEEPKRGLFGRLKGEARLRATYTAPVTPEPETVPAEPVIESSDIDSSFDSDSAIVNTPDISDMPDAENGTEQQTEVQDFSEVDAQPEEPEILSFIDEPDEDTAEESTEDSTIVENPVENPEVMPEAVPDGEEILPFTAETAAEDAIQVEEMIIGGDSTYSTEHSTTVENPVENPETVKNIPMVSDTELVAGNPSEAAMQKVACAKCYLLEVLQAMHVQAELKAHAGRDSALIEIQTKQSGAVIGKHGDTLDALQYLTFMAANHGDKEYYRIILDTANYRERRKKTLEELAARISKNVLKSGRQGRLEPMNPYERRIIHSVVAEIDGVVSQSVGEEPYRKVIISLENQSERPGRRRNSDGYSKNYHKNHDRNHDKNYNKSRQRRNHSQGKRSHYRKDEREEIPAGRISMDSMKTDFEKDYRRPRPEDELNAGLYGKIEF